MGAYAFCTVLYALLNFSHLEQSGHLLIAGTLALNEMDIITSRKMIGSHGTYLQLTKQNK